MPHLTASYPADVPEFIRTPAAPVEWQERVQRLDRDLWVCWNPHHRAGPTWCIVRWHGRLGARRDGGVLILKEGHADLFAALKTGYSLVESCVSPEGRPCGLEGSNGDMILASIRGSDLKEQLGDDEVDAAEALVQQSKDAAAGRDATSKGLWKEAFEETLSDEKTSSIASRPYQPGTLILPESF